MYMTEQKQKREGNGIDGTEIEGSLLDTKIWCGSVLFIQWTSVDCSFLVRWESWNVLSLQWSCYE